MRIDPFFQSIPWEIHRNEQGEIIAEVFLLPPVVKYEGIWKGVKRK